jgi:arabinan endo-1,5-alpha-L-arabinosidase
LILSSSSCSFSIRSPFFLLYHEAAKMRISTIASLVLSAASSVYGYADPMACTGICNNAHDPALIRRDDGTYYRFSTGGKIAIHSAPSITGPWTYKGAAIPAGSKINLKGNTDLWVSPPHQARIEY